MKLVTNNLRIGLHLNRGAENRFTGGVIANGVLRSIFAGHHILVRRFAVKTLKNDFALTFRQRPGTDSVALFVCGLHLKLASSSNPTISRALRTQNL